MITIYVNNYEEYIALCNKVKAEGKKVFNMHVDVKTKRIAVIIVKR